MVSHSSQIIPPSSHGSSNITPIHEAGPVIVPTVSSSTEAAPQTTSRAITEHLTPTVHHTLPEPKSVSSSSTTIEQNASKMTWAGLKAFGEVLKSSASTFGPLKAAVEGISGCLELFEVHLPITYLVFS
jgi:hypothetical protein